MATRTALGMLAKRGVTAGEQMHATALALPVGLTCVLICIVIELLYRPYIYSNQIQDLWSGRLGCELF